jgi:hypothetical protein
MLLKTNNEENNNYFLTALKQYASIAISPAYKKGIKEEEEQIEEKVLDEIYAQIEAWENENKRFVFETNNTKLKNLFEVRDRTKGDLQKQKEKEIKLQYDTMIQQIGNLETESDAILAILQKHLRKFPKHLVLLGLQEYMNGLGRTLSGQRSAVEVYRDLIAVFGNPAEIGTKETGSKSGEPKPPGWLSRFWHENSSKIMAAAVVLAIFVSIFIWKLKEQIIKKVIVEEPFDTPTIEEKCTIYFYNRDWTADELLKDLQKEITKKKKEDYVIAGCNKILEKCPNFKDIEEVNNLKNRAEDIKKYNQ